jgi:hypothetical protein
MGLQYAGSVSLGALVPSVFSLSAVVGYLGAQLSAAVNASLNIGLVPPTIVATAELAASILANLEVAVSAGLTPPSISLSASISAQIALLEGLVAALNLALGPLTAGGIDAWTWSGAAGDFGPALSVALAAGPPSGGGPLVQSGGIVLLAHTPAASAALSAFFSGA